MPDKDTVWQADGDTLSPDKPVTLTWDNGQGLTFARKFEIDADYMFTVTDTVTNGGGAPVELAPYGRVVRYGTPLGASQTYVLHEGPIGVFDGALKEHSYGSARDEAEDAAKFTYPSTGGWMGISDKYWLVTQIAAAGRSADQQHVLRPQGRLLSGRVLVRASPGPGRRQRHAQTASVRRREGREHARPNIATNLELPLFDRAVDFGWFWFLTKPLFVVLDTIYRYVGNFGIAILCLTVLVKLVMFPLANKSYRSMSKMKILAPKMQELKAKYGDDRAKMNQEMMALYKREKVNPAAGCLPIVVQIPVFYALYKVIFVTIEMRHAPFFGWIRDLSAPDPTSILNLFGLIPWDYHVLFAIPVLGGLFHILSIGVWPLIMGFTMWAQMRLNPTPPDPVQARIFG